MPSSTLEAHCLGVILRRPSLIYRIDRELQEHGLSRLSYKDFQNSDYQVILDLIIDSLNQTQSEPLNFVLNSLPLPLMDVADGTLAQTKSLNPNEDAVLEDLLRGILNLRRSKLRQRNNHLRFLQEEAQQDGDLRATEHQETAVQNIMAMQRIDKALGNYTYEPRN